MEKIKTLTYLNTKAWYRALKVIYIFFVLICYLIAVGGTVVHTIYILDSQKEYKNEQIAVDKRLQKIQELKDAGQTPTQITDTVYGEFKKYGPIRLTRAEYLKLYGEQEALRLDAISPPKTESEKPESYIWLILYIPLYFLAALILSEIPRRIFYYVYLGTVRPEK